MMTPFLRMVLDQSVIYIYYIYYLSTGSLYPARINQPIIASNSASVSTGTPSERALSSLLPAFSPATR